MTASRLIAALAAAMLSVAAIAQDRQRGERPVVEYTGPVYPHSSRGELRSMPRRPAWQPGDPIKVIPKRRKPPAAPPLVRPGPRPDPLLRESAPASRVNRVFSSPTVNVPGQGFSGVQPPDTVGDVGPGHYVQAINAPGGTAVTVYSKAGTVLSGPTALDMLGAADCADGLGDPVVLYDAIADRWLLSEFSNSGNKMCVYVSQTGDPAGSYFNYEFAAPSFPDYPKYSVWPDAYYVTSNESGNSPVYALERTAMLAGAGARMLRTAAPSLPGFGFQALTPVDLDGSAPPPAGAPGLFVRHRDDEVHGSSPALIDDGAWHSYSTDISGIALGSGDVRIRFSFDTVDGLFNNFEGWHIDDVVVSIDGSAVYSEVVDESGAGWTTSGLWGPTTACSAPGTSSPPFTFYYGQDFASCNYNTGGVANSGTLLSPGIDLSSGASATLSFSYFLRTEVGCAFAGGPFDVARVEISTDGGTTFSILAGNCDRPVTPNDQVQLFEFMVDWAPSPGTPTGLLLGPINIEMADFDSDLCGLVSFNCFPQPGTGITLDPLREVVMFSPKYRNFGMHQSIVGNFVTDVSGTDQGGIRWFELRRPNSGSWALHQQGTHAPDTVNRWMGSIAMDGAGNMALGYNGSDGTSTFPSIGFAGRLESDAPGTLPVSETILAAGGGSNTNNRYGDYTAMSVDPADDCSFWYTAQYNPTTSWGTRIGSFAFAGCAPVVEPSCSGIAPYVSGIAFDADAVCVGSQSWSAGSQPPTDALAAARSVGGPVSVTANSTLRVYAPTIHLGPGFSVSPGSSLELGSQ